MASEVLVDQTTETRLRRSTSLDLVVELSGGAARAAAGGEDIADAVAVDAIALTDQVAHNNRVGSSVQSELGHVVVSTGRGEGSAWVHESVNAGPEAASTALAETNLPLVSASTGRSGLATLLNLVEELAGSARAAAGGDHDISAEVALESIALTDDVTSVKRRDAQPVEEARAVIVVGASNGDGGAGAEVTQDAVTSASVAHIKETNLPFLSSHYTSIINTV